MLSNIRGLNIKRTNRPMLMLLFICCVLSCRTDTNRINDNEIAEQGISLPPWITKGTLHKAFKEDWLNASMEERIGTSGAFIILANQNDNGTYADLKQEAISLSQCVTRQYEVDSAFRASPSFEVASYCLVMFMGYE